MNYKGILKRVLPFFAAFIGGLLISSIFVPITPNIGKYNSERRAQKFERHHRTKAENHRLRRENERLRAENEALKSSVEVMEFDSIEMDVPPPPPAPKRIRLERVER